MADQILKLQPIPNDATVDGIKNILKDFKVSEVSIRGDAAYVKFEEFSQSEKELFEFTFETNKYDEEGWNANLTLLPAADWDSEEGEVIQDKSPKDSEAEELKKTEAVSQTTQEIAPEVIQENVQEKVQRIVPDSRETEQISVPQQLVQPSEVFSSKVANSSQPGIIKREEPSLVRPSGIKEEVQGLLNEAKDAVCKQLNLQGGNVIPQWVWPVALSWTMLSLAFCH